jgi:hypothetical protein
MAEIYRVLLMRFAQAAVDVKYFLVEPDGGFFCVDFFHVLCQPS